MKYDINKILKLPAIEAAPLLLGWALSRKTREGDIKMRIVETEAYHQADPASHSFRGKTARTAPMFEAGGTIYVYFTYGMHYCLNIVVGPMGRGEAVLIRAGEPLEGIKFMQKNRGTADIYKLAKGPACLTQAFGIKNTSLSGKKLNKSSIYLQAPKDVVRSSDIITTSRIGIREAVQSPWRFYIKGNPFVSKP